MKTIYIDPDFKCYQTDDGNMTAVETDVFDGYCDTFIEGCRLVPFGAIWTREDGEVFTGLMVAPWKDYAELDEAQRAYEQEKLADMEAAYNYLLTGGTA